MTLSIIYKTQTHDREQTLRKSINTLNQSNIDTEIIVLSDNNELLNWYQESLPADKYLHSKTGLVASRNQGATIASKKYIAFMDDDAIPHTDWASRTVRNLEDNIVVGGPIYPKWNTQKPNWLPKAYHWLIGCGPYYDTPQYVPNTYGSNFAIHKNIYMKTGGFNETIGAGQDVNQGEEQEYTNRLRHYGYQSVYYDPDAIVYHEITPSDIGFAVLSRRAYDQGVSKAVTGVGDRETQFIRNELLTADSLTQLLVVAWFTGLVGSGYVKQKLL